MVPTEPLALPLQSDSTGSAIGLGIILLFALVATAIQVAGVWKIFEKAGEAGWTALIPVYNLYVMLEIGENAWWWLLLVFIPIVNFVAAIKIHAGVARAFGKGIGFALGMTFLNIVFYPLLGFGEYQYQPQSGELA